MSMAHLEWWGNLRHGGLLLDVQRLGELLPALPGVPAFHVQERLRRQMMGFVDAPDAKRTEWVAFVLERLCGFRSEDSGEWFRGGNVASGWSVSGLAGETLRPQHLWLGRNDATLPVFINDAKRLGIGRGRRVVTQALQWLRGAKRPLALVTNGSQWRLVFAGLDYDAFCEWEADQWLAEGDISDNLLGFIGLIAPATWVAESATADARLLAAINDSRKGQSDLSKTLGERIRQAAELLVRAHTQALNRPLDAANPADLAPEDIYRAAVRMVMRMVVVLFAESREGLLPRDNPIYHGSYSLQGLRDLLDRVGPQRLAESFSAYPRILSLMRLIHDGCDHEALPVPTYGGDLFAPCPADAADGMRRAIHLFENACFAGDAVSDLQVRQMLDLLTRTKIRLRAGRAATWVTAPVDFAGLKSEYIGILYEGLLDFELHQAKPDEPVVFLAVGNQPALPLTTLEAMDDKAIRNLLENMKDASSGEEDEEGTGDGEQGTEEATDQTDQTDPSDEPDVPDEPEPPDADTADELKLSLQGRAEAWASRAIEVGKLVPKPRGSSPEKLLAHQRQLAAKARQLIVRVVLPGEWYLIRWGGTRKGSGSFYTRPQLAIPTVHRTLAPLCYAGTGNGEQGTGNASGGSGALPPTPPPGRPDSPAPSQRDLRNSQTLGAPANSANPVADASRGATPKADNNPHCAAGPTGSGISVAGTPGTEIPEPSDVGSGESRFPGGGVGAAPLRPRRPEEILSLKVCDPACGSGSFPLAALRYLTEALYESLQVHGRIKEYGGESVLELIYDREGRELLVDEKLPCRPDDDTFEDRLKAVLRRHVVERCIYGVDLDPLAVELCRLSLWIETLDPRLPMTFLEHKIKCGNSLVGAWFDQFMHYPVMAWKREAGDETHTNGVNHGKGERAQAMKDFLKDTVAPDLELTLAAMGRDLFLATKLQQAAKSARELHQAAFDALAAIHNLPVHETAKRAEMYRQLVARDDYRQLKRALDAWCAIWFWPADQLAAAPLPANLNDLPAASAAIVDQVADRKRFFHWELEFPDVFADVGAPPQAPLGDVQTSPPRRVQDPRPPSHRDLRTPQTLRAPANSANPVADASRIESPLATPPSPSSPVPSSQFPVPSASAPVPRSQFPVPSASASASAPVPRSPFPVPNASASAPVPRSLFPVPGGSAAFTGFDAILGNPPWDTAKPVSKEFFSNLDPLYRSYGKQEALKKQTEYFQLGARSAERGAESNGNGGGGAAGNGEQGTGSGQRAVGSGNSEATSPSAAADATRSADSATAQQLRSPQNRCEGGSGEVATSPDGGVGAAPPPSVERDWLDYCGDFKAQSHFVKYAANAYGDPEVNESSGDRFSVTRGARNLEMHKTWRKARASSFGFADPAHGFRHQGGGDVNLYKLFLEQAHALLRRDGRMGFIVPSGVYSDHGTGPLRELFLDHCRWEWLFGFENRAKIFDIDSRFKFNPVIIRKGGRTEAIRTAFMRRKLSDWESAEAFATDYDRERILALSPFNKGILEIGNPQDLAVIGRIYRGSVLFSAACPEGFSARYSREFHMGDDVGNFKNREFFESKGYLPTNEGTWVNNLGERILPLYEGRMVEPFLFTGKGWVSGKGRTAVWRDIASTEGVIEPQFLMPASYVETSVKFRGYPRLGVVRISSSTNARTVKSALIPGYPCGDSCYTIRCEEVGIKEHLTLLAVVNSFVFDFVVRLRMSGLQVSDHMLQETAVPERLKASLIFQKMAPLSGSLSFTGPPMSVEMVLYAAASGQEELDCIAALLPHERFRLRATLEALVTLAYGLDRAEIFWIMKDCDWPLEYVRNNAFCASLNPKGFWRVDKDKPPEQRLTVLSLVAFHDLQAKIAACGGDVDKGIEAFCTQNDGEGWMLPDRLRLADYGLGHDDRAKQYQPVRECFGPRFYDWQLAQSPEESWRECHLHARNLLGTAGYAQLLAEIEESSEHGARSTEQEIQPSTRHQAPKHAAKPLEYADSADEPVDMAAEDKPDFGDLPLFGGKK